jgi:tetratricopeptide (TPR) repeat protein
VHETFTRALAALRQQARHDRELLRTIYGKLGVIDYDAGQYSTASENLREALALHHEDGADRHRILIWLGDCHLAMGARAQALAYYEEVATSPLASDEEREHAREGIRTIDQ